jgi:hypothetical protein
VRSAAGLRRDQERLARGDATAYGRPGPRVQLLGRCLFFYGRCGHPARARKYPRLLGNLTTVLRQATAPAVRRPFGLFAAAAGLLVPAQPGDGGVRRARVSQDPAPVSRERNAHAKDKKWKSKTMIPERTHSAAPPVPSGCRSRPFRGTSGCTTGSARAAGSVTTPRRETGASATGRDQSRSP